MARIEEEVLVPASLAETWDAYFDRTRWTSWVDSFSGVSGTSGGYPEAGSELHWRSVPAGRGDVVERVLEHEPRRVHRIAFEDLAMAGEMETRMAIEGEGTLVRVVYDYRLSQPGPFVWLASLVFVKGQVRGTLRRSLEAFRAEFR